MSSSAGDDASPSGRVVHLHLAEVDELLGELVGDVGLVGVVGAVSSPVVRHAERVEEGVEGGVDLVGGLLVDPVAGAVDDRLAAEVGAAGARVGVQVDAGEHRADRVERRRR